MICDSGGIWRCLGGGLRAESYGVRLSVLPEPAPGDACVAPARRLQRVSAEADGGRAGAAARKSVRGCPGGRACAAAPGRAAARRFRRRSKSAELVTSGRAERVGVGRSQLTRTLRSMSAIGSCAGERHRDVELLADDLDRPRDAGLAAGAQAVDVGAADQAALGAERERAHHVLAGADAAVEQDLDLRADCVDDRAAASRSTTARRRAGGRRGWRRRSPSAPVLAAILASSTSRMPLMISLPGQMLADPFDVLPVQRRVELVRDPFGQRLDARPRPSRGRRDCRRSSACRRARRRPSAAWSPCR